jgi:hypothetical protein
MRRHASGGGTGAELAHLPDERFDSFAAVLRLDHGGRNFERPQAFAQEADSNAKLTQRGAYFWHIAHAQPDFGFQLSHGPVLSRQSGLR